MSEKFSVTAFAKSKGLDAKLNMIYYIQLFDVASKTHLYNKVGKTTNFISRFSYYFSHFAVIIRKLYLVDNVILAEKAVHRAIRNKYGFAIYGNEYYYPEDKDEEFIHTIEDALKSFSVTEINLEATSHTYYSPSNKPKRSDKEGIISAFKEYAQDEDNIEDGNILPITYKTDKIYNGIDLYKYITGLRDINYKEEDSNSYKFKLEMIEGISNVLGYKIVNVLPKSGIKSRSYRRRETEMEINTIINMLMEYKSLPHVRSETIYHGYTLNRLTNVVFEVVRGKQNTISKEYLQEKLISAGFNTLSEILSPQSGMQDYQIYMKTNALLAYCLTYGYLPQRDRKGTVVFYDTMSNKIYESKNEYSKDHPNKLPDMLWEYKLSTLYALTNASHRINAFKDEIDFIISKYKSHTKCINPSRGAIMISSIKIVDKEIHSLEIKLYSNDILNQLLSTDTLRILKNKLTYTIQYASDGMHIVSNVPRNMDILHACVIAVKDCCEYNIHFNRCDLRDNGVIRPLFRMLSYISQKCFEHRSPMHNKRDDEIIPLIEIINIYYKTISENGLSINIGKQLTSCIYFYYNYITFKTFLCINSPDFKESVHINEIRRKEKQQKELRNIIEIIKICAKSVNKDMSNHEILEWISEEIIELSNIDSIQFTKEDLDSILKVISKENITPETAKQIIKSSLNSDVQKK